MNRLQVYTQQQCKRIPLLLHAYQLQQQPEDMHQLRVAIKKLRAVVRYLRTTDGKELKCFAHMLRHYFRQAGSIREAELQLQWLQENGGNALIAALHFQQTIHERIADLQQLSEHFEKKFTAETSVLLRYCHRQQNVSIKTYALALRQQFLHLAVAAHAAEWHELRKLLKQVLYAWHWLENNEQLTVLTVRQYQQCDALQEAIGSWHDAVIRAEWLGATQCYLHQKNHIRSGLII